MGTEGPGIRLYTSNRLEILGRKLAETLQNPLSSPFEPEIIVVQSKGMERWVRLALARNHGVCAHCRFPFPNRFVQETFSRALPEVPQVSSFEPQIMTWRIARLLPSCLEKPAFKGLRHYLGDPADALKRLQLSHRIADTLDQYLIFRPQMVFSWEQGRAEHWQAALWRALVSEAGPVHRLAQARTFLQKARAQNALEDLPQRISVFGISALPRFHMEILAALSGFVTVNLFLLNPCQEYWGDILSDHETRKRAPALGQGRQAVEDLHLERGNPLLASMGTLGRDFFDLVNEFPCQEFPCFQDPGRETLLAAIQSDILNLQDRTRPGEKRLPLSPGDTTFQIHACHSPMREMEVLKDRLLHMFEQDPLLEPGDILVMAPDIEAYAPYVQAVFDLPQDDAKRIPFTIADRRLQRESEVVDAFLGFLDLYESRFEAPRVLSLLESPSVRRRFSLTGAELERIHRWVKETGIRWGLNKKHRAQQGLLAFGEHTWESGLERLLLGYALPGRGRRLFKGVLPYDDLEGEEAGLLGRFLEFTHRLFVHIPGLGRPRRLQEWAQALSEILDTFFSPDEDSERDMEALARALHGLGETEEAAGFHEVLDIRTVRWHLERSLETRGYGLGFIAGGVTFCAMLPMRSIPFKVICLVGMNSNAYPRQSKPLGFDFISLHPRRGDRSRRNDDRYLFLESLLSARDRLYISYVGQSIQDNSPIPPSVLVSELIDYIEQAVSPGPTPVREALVTRHHLQAFHPEYFRGNERFYSYSQTNARAARRLVQAPDPPVPFISRGLSVPDPSWESLDLDDLCRFFANPVRYLLNRRLGIYLRDREVLLEPREPFDLKGLDRYRMGQDLLEKGLSGQPLDPLFPLKRASGDLPHGTVGKSLFERMAQDIGHFAAHTAGYLKAPPLEPLPVDIKACGFRITGKIQPVYPDRLLLYRYGGIKAGDRLRTWIYHVLLNAGAPAAYPKTSMLMALDAGSPPEKVWKALEYRPVDHGREILEVLLQAYRKGLSTPLPFFPRSSLKCAELSLRGLSFEEAVQKSQAQWSGNDYTPGEGKDPYFQLCFSDVDPLGRPFFDLAREVFTPLLEHQNEIRGG